MTHLQQAKLFAIWTGKINFSPDSNASAYPKLAF